MGTLPDGSLLAWVEQREDTAFIGAYIGEGATTDNSSDFRGRDPATHVFPSVDEARRWVETEAAALDLPVRWIEPAPRR
ncbi:MAG TPA: hypothetical protein VHO91_11420 [Rhodopila sp.]|nr:hypothetical protein [Rhodopila sp.]